MKWTIGLTLYPGKSYIETTVKLFNRTPEPQSILYWATDHWPLSSAGSVLVSPAAPQLR